MCNEPPDYWTVFDFTLLTLSVVETQTRVYGSMVFCKLVEEAPGRVAGALVCLSPWATAIALKPMGDRLLEALIFLHEAAHYSLGHHLLAWEVFAQHYRGRPAIWEIAADQLAYSWIAPEHYGALTEALETLVGQGLNFGDWGWELPQIPNFGKNL